MTDMTIALSLFAVAMAIVVGFMVVRLVRRRRKDFAAREEREWDSQEEEYNSVARIQADKDGQKWTGGE